MITITRRLAQQLRSVFRRAFGTSRPRCRFHRKCKEGLTARAMLGDVAIEYHEPGERTVKTIRPKVQEQHRRQNKAIQNTLESLKQLRTLGV